jgi:integrase
MDDLLAGIFLRPLRESTKIARDYHCRVAASALTCEDVNPQSITSLEHLTSLEAYQKILGHLIKRHGGTAGGQIGHIAKLLQRTARDRCNATDEQLKRMSAMLKRVWKPQTGMTERNREHLWQFEDAAAVAALVELPLRLAEEARRARSPRDALRKMELALAIDLLLMTAMRIGNLSRLDTERHIIRTRRGNHVLIAIGGQETKNAFDTEFPLPERTVGLVDSCQRYRKQALAYETTALFPGRGCGSRHPTAFGLQIKKTVKAYTGLTINPHLFRHLGAKLYLEANPGSYGVVRLMLGHQSVATTERFYTGTERIAAIRHFQNFILGCSR